MAALENPIEMGRVVCLQEGTQATRDRGEEKIG